MDSDICSEEDKRDNEHAVVNDLADTENAARRKKRRRTQGENDEDGAPKDSDKEVMQL